MTIALLLAAGSGERLGAGRPKAFVELAGRPLVRWSLEALEEVAGIEQIVLALPAGADVSPELLGAHAQRASAAPHSPGGGVPARVIAVQGGGVRSDSVRRALAGAGDGDPVLVHDAARPLLDRALAESVIAALTDDPLADAAIAACPVTDTVKRVDAAGAVVETLQRSGLWAVQTPQVFRRAALERALAVPEQELARATDDAWLIERAGGRVIVVRSRDENLKVTTPLDLRVAELLIAERGAARLNPD